MSSNVRVTESVIFDPMRPSNLQEPFGFFAKLRAEQPVYWNQQYSFWMLTQYQDVKAALKAPRQFSSATGVQIDKLADGIPASARTSFDICRRFAYSHMQTSDPPSHTDLRAAVSNAFTPQAVAKMRASIQRQADALLDEMERAQTCDFVSKFAYALPSVVIFDLLGVPENHHDTIREATHAAMALEEILYRRDFKGLEYIAERFIEIERIYGQLIQERRREPKNDLISILAHGQDGTKQLPDDELVVLSALLLGAGHETTANLLSGSLRSLLERPELWEQLREAPEMIPSAVDELLRFVSPVLWLPRLTMEDTELHGKVLHRGSRVQLGIGAGNHDPTEFTNPDELDFTRGKANSLAFGSGPHYCLGATLARLEGQVALSRLLERIPRVRLGTQRFEYRPLFFVHALKSLPIVVHDV